MNTRNSLLIAFMLVYITFYINLYSKLHCMNQYFLYEVCSLVVHILRSIDVPEMLKLSDTRLAAAALHQY